MAAKVLVVGSGSREDALSWKLAQSDSVGQVFVSPGNAGSDLARDKIKTISLDMHKHEKVISWCRDNNINLVVIGPEDLLANGLSDDLTKAGIPCFGPSAQAAQIESSKAFSKDLMTKNGVPTARWQAFTNSKEACEFINSSDFPALVVKASGLASGKGVIIAADKEAACQAVVDVLDGQLFGNAGSTVVIEELLEGDEISCLAFCDGKTFVCMPPTQDHKRLLDGDQGPNTGGMGAYCPCPLVRESIADISTELPCLNDLENSGRLPVQQISDDALELVKKEVLQKTLDALRDIGSPFVGVLYAGLMLTKNGPKVLEFNCRFGDPETQVLLPLLKSDLYQILDHCVQGKLQSTDVLFDTTKTALGVVLASSGYPATYRKGLPITNIDLAQSKYNANIFYAGAALDGEQVITRGGRVLTVVVTAPDMDTASKMAQQAANEIQFEGKQFRTDIGFRALRPTQLSQLTYKDSGVDIEAGDCLVEKIKSLAASTVRLGCIPNLGSFGGLFDMKAIGYTDPLLVSGTDGVGTKLKIAQSIGIHNTIGIDLVAMCVNDILCHGAEPLFFLDYFACGFLELDAAKSVIEGISVGCRQANCALIGGETAEMPGMYQRGEYDLAGFAVGAVERSLCLPKLNDIHEGDVIIGLTSSGFHSNGFSLVRKVVDNCQLAYDSPSPFDPSKTLGESLLVPTKIYISSLLSVMKSGMVKAAAHITGGGLPGNVERVLPASLGAALDASMWPMPPVFGWLSAKGNISVDEMLRTFNCGIGMVVVTDYERSNQLLNLLNTDANVAFRIGLVNKHSPDTEKVGVTNLSKALNSSYCVHDVNDKVASLTLSNNVIVAKKRVAVLISGSGTNLQALIDFSKNSGNNSSFEIVLVVSNCETAYGLKRAEMAGVPTAVINHKNYKTREEFDDVIHEKLVSTKVDIICLAGFMRILSGPFVHKWQGRLLNIHPSLLPSFKGMNAHKLVLEAGVRITGCTVHFVAEEVDCGAILAQESVPVCAGDTVDILQERVKTAEHVAYPRALELLCSGKAILGDAGRIHWS